MRNHLMLQTRSALFVALASAACGHEALKQTPIESASVSHLRPPLHVIEAEGGLATRREAQEFLDRAREALAVGSPSSASTALYEAAGFFREQTELAKAGAQAGLERAAADLALLALRLEGGDTVLSAELDLTFARAQIAEAMNHCLLAKDAMHQREPGRAGDEITMAIDHYERDQGWAPGAFRVGARVGGGCPRGCRQPASRKPCPTNDSEGNRRARGSNYENDGETRAPLELSRELRHAGGWS